MYRIRLVFRRFIKGLSLRSVNLVGLALIFVCLLISAVFVHQELSFDRFHTKADRIVRLQVRNGEITYGARVFDGGLDKLPVAIPEIEGVVLLSKINTATLEYEGEKQLVNDVYYASPSFFELFDFSLVEGDKADVLKAPESVVISRRLATLLYGNEQPLGKNLRITGRKVMPGDLTVTGVFEDMPANSHWHTDMLIRRPDEFSGLSYAYLLLPENNVKEDTKQKIADFLKQNIPLPDEYKVTLQPLSGIHLYSHESGEMESNGDIKYVYLLISSNLLLLIVVLFNLWLNSKVIFLNNLKYYQLVKLNGATSGTVLLDELALASLSCLIVVGVGLGIAFYVASVFNLALVPFLQTDWFPVLLLLFVALVLAISGLPVLAWFSSHALSSVSSLLPKKMQFSSMKYMLVIQYAVVMAVLILTIGISRQMEFIKIMQPGGQDEQIMVMDEQPAAVIDRFDLLKEELLKHPEIAEVTACMALPGGTLKDQVEISNFGSEEKYTVSTLIVDPDFFSFFHLNVLAGKTDLAYPYSYSAERQMLEDAAAGSLDKSVLSEYYVINRSAMKVLGFQTPEEAVGKMIKQDHQMIGFIPKGTIVGVVEDFTYANVREKVTPAVMMCRKLFLQCFMVRTNPLTKDRVSETFKTAWDKINPDYPLNYVMLQDVYGHIYRNEMGAERLLKYFSLLCLLIVNIGLAVFLAFMIRKRRKEISVRKVNGAGMYSVIRLLLWDFLKWLAVAFLFAVPLTYYIMHRWLEGFSYKITVGWWIFAVAGGITLVVALFAVAYQTLRAATENPVKALKSE